jgi:hypothetical protein
MAFVKKLLVQKTVGQQTWVQKTLGQQTIVQTIFGQQVFEQKTRGEQIYCLMNICLTDTWPNAICPTDI